MRVYFYHYDSYIIHSCQNKLSPDQYHVTISQLKSRAHRSWQLISYCFFFIGSWAQANYCNQELCQESVIDLLGFRLVGGRVIALNVTYILPLPKKFTFMRPPRLSTLTKKNDFGGVIWFLAGRKQHLLSQLCIMSQRSVTLQSLMQFMSFGMWSSAYSSTRNPSLR